MKKLTLFATLFVLFLLLGCGGGGSNAGNNTPVAKEWQGVTKVDNLTPNQEITSIAYNKNLSVNKNGNAALIWRQVDGGHQSAFVSFYDFNSNSWSTPAKVDSLPQDIISAKIVLNDNNDAVATWIQKDSSNHENLYLRKYTHDIGWSTTTHLLETNSNDVYNFDMAFVGNRAVISWIQKVGSYNRALVRGYNFQTDSLGGTSVEGIGNNDAYITKVGLDSSGNIMAIWTQIYNSHINLYARRYNNSSSSWESIKTVEHYTSAAIYTNLDMNRVGDVSFIWMQNDGSHVNTYVSFYNHSNNSYTNPVAVDALDTPVSKPSIAINENSDVIATWRQKDSSGNYNVYATIYKKSTNSWSAVERIEDINNNSVYDIKADIDKNGNAIVIWRQKDDSNVDSIYANYFDADENSWTGNLALEDVDYSAVYPTAKIDQNGDVVTAWVQENNLGKNHLYSNIYR